MLLCVAIYHIDYETINTKISFPKSSVKRRQHQVAYTSGRNKQHQPPFAHAVSTGMGKFKRFPATSITQFPVRIWRPVGRLRFRWTWKPCQGARTYYETHRWHSLTEQSPNQNSEHSCRSLFQNFDYARMICPAEECRPQVTDDDQRSANQLGK